MYNKIYAIPGWGFDENAFSSLNLDIEVIDWRYLLKTESIEFSNAIFIGWSLGGYLAIDKIKGDCNLFLLVACGDCFSYKKEKKYGIDPKLISKLKEEIKEDKQAALSRFYSLVFLPRETDNRFLPQLNYFSEDELIAGLDYLDGVSFDLQLLTGKDLRFFMGKKDFVVDRRMAIFLKRNYPFLENSVHILENAGHFIEDYSFEVLKIVNEL